MSNYTKRYNSTNAYLAAKASSGELYQLLTDSSVLSRTVVSCIEGTNGYRTVMDSVNCIVPAREMQIGDVLCFDGNTPLCVKGGTYNASALGGNVIDTARFVYPSSIVLVGWCVERIGNKCWIAAMADESDPDMLFSNNTSAIAGAFADTSVINGSGSPNEIASGSMELAEELYGTTRDLVTWPITRAEWDAAERGASITGADYVTIDKATYNNDFDTYYRNVVLVRHPLRYQGVSGHTGYALSDENGKANTAAIAAAAATEGEECPAVSMCLAKSVDVTGFRAGGWYLPALGQMWRMMKYYKRLKKSGCPITRSDHWSSTLSPSLTAWGVDPRAASVFGFYRRSFSKHVRPFADFQIN